MKNKLKKFLLLILVLIFATTLFVGCGKTNNLVKKCYEYDENDVLYCEMSYTYDKKGRLIEDVEKLHYGEDKIEITKKVYNYNGDLLSYTETYHLEDENKWVKSYCKIYGYDEDGNQVSLFGYSVSGDEKTLFAIDIMEYNGSGKEIKTTSILTDEGDEKKPLTAFSIVKSVYNEAGDLTKIEYYSIFDDVTFEILDELKLDEYYLYSYNDDGTIKEIEDYYRENKYITRYTYNANGNETKEEMFNVLDGTETLLRRVTSEYDKNNRLIKKTTFILNEETGEIEKSSSIVYEY